MRPFGKRKLQVAQRRQGDALFVGRPHDHIDQIDTVPYLRDSHARHHLVEHCRDGVRAQAQEPCLVLIDADTNLPGRLDPIEIDPPRAGVRGDGLGEPKSDIAHFVHVRTAEAILHRPTDRRAEFQRNGTRHRTRELFLEHAFQLRAKSLAGGDVLCNDDELAEEIVGQFDAERQIESDGAAPDIGAPSFDVGIALEDRVELGGGIAAGVDRSALRQPQIDQQFRPVRRREELSGHRGDGKQGDNEADERYQDGEPSHPHGGDEHVAEDAGDQTGLGRLCSLRLGQQRDAQKGNEDDRNQPRRQHRDADDGEDRERVFAGRALRKPYRHKARHRHERSRQHRERQRLVGECGGLFLFVALRETHRHGVDRAHGVVDQQGQRDDERAQAKCAADRC